MAGIPNNALRRRMLEEQEFDRQKQERELLRQGDPDSRFNDYLAERSYEGMDDPFMHYLNTLEGRQSFQRERVPLQQDVLPPLQRYMDRRKQLHRKQGR